MEVRSLTIDVASRPEAGDILVSPQRCAEITCLVSIGDSHDELPAGYDNVTRKLRLLVADVVTELGATEDDIWRIIRLAEGLRSETGRVLIHCEAGVSRSSAAALIMYASWLGPGREQEAMERVLSQRPVAIPNRRMIELADKLLDRGGRLVEALAVRHPDGVNWGEEVIIVSRGLAVVLGLAGSACVLITDAATRLGEDLVENAALLQQEGGAERMFSHQPSSWPSGCQADYIVTLQESLHHPGSGGSLLVGCKGEPNFQAAGYSYSTTYHLNAVRVPKELSADKRAGSPLRVTLRKQGDVIDVVEVE